MQILKKFKVLIISILLFLLSICYVYGQSLQYENLKLNNEVTRLENVINDLKAKNELLAEEYQNSLPKWRSLGIYKITNYCSCYECNGKWTGYLTRLGTDYVEGRTIGVDTDYIPLGSKIMIDNHVYIAEDTGSFKGQIIDIYVTDHSKFDRKYKEIFILEE